MILEYQDIFYNQISLKIKELRKKLGLTQVAFAEKLSLSRASIVNIEQNRHKPSVHLLYEISVLGNVDMNFFFEGLPSISDNLTIKKKFENKIDESVLDEKAKDKIRLFISTSIKKTKD